MSEKKIFIKLTGGLGNQLFQYYFGQRCAAECASRVFYDTSWFQGRKKTHERLRLDDLNLPWAKIEENDLKMPFLYTNKVLKRIPFPTKIKYINERSLEQIDYVNSKKSIYFDGFWQIEAMYSKARLLVTAEISGNLEKIFPSKNLDCDLNYSASIHIRRGDYLTLKNHNPQSVEYYLRSIEQAKIRKNIKTFYIFSDDPRWFIGKIQRQGCEFIDGSALGKNYDLAEFDLIRRFKNHIISNSTFSWWGAWIGSTQTDGLICYPRGMDKKFIPKHPKEEWTEIDD